MRWDKMTVRDDFKLEGKRLMFDTHSGWFDSGAKCVRNIGRFKVFATYIDCSLPYTRYCVADTESGEVRTGVAHHDYVGDGSLKSLVRDLERRS